MVTTYNIDRETAARLLEVSVRTVDRYVQTQKLSSVKSEGRIWLSKDEILKMLGSRSQRSLKSQKTVESRPIEPDIILENDNNVTTPPVPTVDNSLSTDEYLRLQMELKVKETELTVAKSRIQELENEVNSLKPLLQLSERTQEFERIIEAKEQEISDISLQHEKHREEIKQLHKEELILQQNLLEQLDHQLHEERVNKWIYSITLYIVIACFVGFWAVLKLS